MITVDIIDNNAVEPKGALSMTFCGEFVTLLYGSSERIFVQKKGGYHLM